MSSAAIAGVEPGDILAQKYRIDRILGSGGMGLVVAAHHLRLDERVAIKFLHPATVANREAVTRFEREARTAVKIKSEHVARVSDVGTLANGAPYMVMEYLEGEDLSTWLKLRGPLPFEQAADFILQACEAVAEAHSLGIVHRDLKPANLFVIRRRDGTLSVKVLDFGISKMRGSGAALPQVSLTKTSVMLGSPLYMSPEQLQPGLQVDVRTDIWALGVILYELVAGSSPFASSTVPEFVEKVLSTTPAPLASVRHGIPAGLEAVVRRCLERDPNQRYGSIALLAADLLHFAPPHARISLERVAGVLRGVGSGDVSPTLLDAPPSTLQSNVRSARAPSPPPRSAKSGGALILLVACLLLAGVAAIFWFRHAPASVATLPPLAASTAASPALPPTTPVHVTRATTSAIAATPPAPSLAPPARATSSAPRAKKPLVKAPLGEASAPAPELAPAPPDTSQDGAALDDRK